MQKLTPDEKEQRRQKFIRQRRKNRQDLDRWHRHPKDGLLVGWPDQDIMDKIQRRNTVLLSLSPFIAVAVGYLLSLLIHF